MNRLFYLAILTFSFLFLSASSTDEVLLPGIQEEITLAVKSGKAAELAKFFGNTVDLNIPGNENTFSKAQAELIMKDFFAKNPPQSFKINHQGSSKDGSLYYIGTYQTNRNKNFRTYFLLKKAGEKYFIQQLQFEQD